MRADIAMVVLAAMISESSAAFAPNSRAELQAATFGCVGACGQGLSGSGDGTYCSLMPTGLGNPVRAVLAAIETVSFQAVKEAALME